MVDSRYILTLYPLNNKVKEKVCEKNMQLSDSIREIKGIGEKSEKLFAKLGISTVEELLFFYPREYEIVENIRPINEVQEGGGQRDSWKQAETPVCPQFKDCQHLSAGCQRTA